MHRREGGKDYQAGIGQADIYRKEQPSRSFSLRSEDFASAKFNFVTIGKISRSKTVPFCLSRLYLFYCSNIDKAQD